MAARSLTPRLAEELYRQETWASQVELAAALDTSPSALTPWIRLLTFQRVLNPQTQGFTVDRDRLLRVLTSLRLGTLRPMQPLHVPFDVDMIHARLRDRDVAHVFCFFTAANRYAFFEPRRDVQIYVPPGATSRLRSALNARLGLNDPFTVVQPFEEPLEQIGRTDWGGFPVTTPLQTVIDLRAHPEGGAHATFLTERLLPRVFRR